MQEQPLTRQRRFPAIIKTRAPAGFGALVAQAAEARAQSSSEYVRGAICERLLRDGFGRYAVPNSSCRL